MLDVLHNYEKRNSENTIVSYQLIKRSYISKKHTACVYLFFVLIADYFFNIQNTYINKLYKVMLPNKDCKHTTIMIKPIVYKS